MKNIEATVSIPTLAFELTTEALEEGFTIAETAAMIQAQVRDGVLQPGRPNWLRASALYKLQAGKCSTKLNLEEHAAIVSQIAENRPRRTDPSTPHGKPSPMDPTNPVSSP